VQELKKMEKDCAQKKKKMDDELKRIEEANAGYESMGMEIAGLKEELEEAKAALQEASEESVDSQLQGFMDDCNSLKAEIDKVNPFCHLNDSHRTSFFLHSTLGWAFKSLQSLRAVNSWPLRRPTCYYID
jgi:DNA repair exonuclease SbcCD ATPase subunit